MAEPTSLDRAQARMDALPEDDAARLAYYAALADTELFLLLATEPVDDQAEPRLFPLAEGRFALAFDREERLAALSEGPAPYVALPGRIAAQLLAGKGIGLGVNLGTDHAVLLPPEALDWLTGTITRAPDRSVARPAAYGAPDGLPDGLVNALEGKLARLAGLATRAHLVAVTYKDGACAHLLAFVGAESAAEAALAKAVSEAVIFSGADSAALDVTFVAEGDPGLDALVAHARTFALPARPARPAAEGAPPGPGLDPAKPPRLR